MVVAAASPSRYSCAWWTEIDFGIVTDEVFLLGEAEWGSSVGSTQGRNRDKDQITFRRFHD